MPRLRLKRSDVAAAVRRAAGSPRRAGYETYWAELAPRTDADFFRRWLFAYASVQTGWARNVVIYRALAAPGVDYTERGLRAVLRSCGAGMFGVRSRGIARLRADYERDPSWFRVQPGETWHDARDRLVRAVHGLGLAKVSFALELCYPLTCRVACLDRHILRLAGVDPARATPAAYRRAEAAWVAECGRCGVPSPIARHLAWDDVQGQLSTRYWSWCLEGPGEQPPDPAQATLARPTRPLDPASTEVPRC